MDATMLCNAVTLESAPATLPAALVPRTFSGASLLTHSCQLDRLSRNTITVIPSDYPHKKHPPDLEMSHPNSRTPNVPSAPIPSIFHPYMNRFRLLAACLINLTNGLNDSAPGALLPYLETHYQIGYAVVSLIFVANAVGFITGALLIESLRRKLGRARLLFAAELAIAGAYLPLVLAAPFPWVCVAFFVIGLGASINLAVGNVFCGSLRNATSALGLMHGGYGIGGTIAPLIATAIVTVGAASWSRYYFLPLGLNVINAGFAAWAYWKYESELGAEHPLVKGRDSEGMLGMLQGMWSAFQSRVVLLGALFIFAYQGAEVSISGWVISFLITERGGDPAAVGYVTAGFWGGITMGRLLMSSPAHRIGEKRFVYGATAAVVLFQLLVWLVPNVVGDAVAVAIVGLFLGPVYPCSAAVFMRSMGREEQVNGMGLISAFGSSGGAVAPFTTGLLAQAAGTFVMHPIAIGLFGLMLACWWASPSEDKREE